MTTTNEKCDNCGKDAVHNLGYYGFDVVVGCTRFLVTLRFCDDCLAEHKKEHPEAGFIKHIR